MKIFFDEDLGKGVATALYAVGLSAYHVGPGQPIAKQTPDEEWIPIAGRQGWLVVSANREILSSEAQRSLWVEHRVGGVFLTTGRITAVGLLRLIIRKLAWLEQVDSHEPRPFAFLLNPRGQTTRFEGM